MLALLLGGFANAQTEFSFDCVAAYNAEIAAIPDAMMDDPDDLYDRVAYLK